jgi:PAS domain S-box-containing protein
MPVKQQVNPSLKEANDLKAVQTNHANVAVVNRETLSSPMDESDELFSKAFYSSSDYVVITRISDRTVVRANEAICRFWGCPPENVIGKTGASFASWLNEGERQVFLQTLQDKGEFLDYETTLRMADGRLIHCNISSHLITFAGERCVFTMMRDKTALKAAEAAAAQLAAIVQFSDDAIIGKNLDGIVSSWNAGAEKIFGHTAAEMIGQKIGLLIPPDRQHEEDLILGKIRRGESVRHYETVRVRKDGRAINVSVTISPIKDSSGRITGASKVARDITERKKVEDEREKLVRLIEHSLDFIAMADLQGKITFMNASARKMIGVDGGQDLGGLHFTDYVPLEWQDYFRNTVIETARNHGVWEGEMQLRNMKTGSLIDVSRTTFLLRDLDGHPSLFATVTRDITERKRAERSLRRSREEFKDLFDNAPLGYHEVDTEGRLARINKTELKMLGYTEKELLGQFVWKISGDEELSRRAVQSKLNGEPPPAAFERILKRKDGSTFPALIEDRIVRDESGRIIGIRAVIQDITERKRAEEQIHRLNAELEQRVIQRTAQLEAANKELEAFSYSVSHDLRAPLRAVNGFAGIVLEDFGPQLPEDGRHYLERIRKGGQRMGELIDDLLAFSRLNRQTVSRQILETGKLVQSCIDELKPQHGGRRFEIKVENLPKCLGDPALLKQVWLNLISNAFKYSCHRETAAVEIGCLREKDGDVFFIRDNGAGFDMQYANKLFGVFQRLHSTEEFEGTGVGLAIVQRIVHRHGGRVWAEAAVNCGATFYFTLEGEAKHE